MTPEQGAQWRPIASHRCSECWWQGTPDEMTKTTIGLATRSQCPRCQAYADDCMDRRPITDEELVILRAEARRQSVDLDSLWSAVLELQGIAVGQPFTSDHEQALHTIAKALQVYAAPPTPPDAQGDDGTEG